MTTFEIQQEIVGNLDNPKQLEKLYQHNKSLFKKAFNAAYPEVQDKVVAQAWHERLNYDQQEISWGSGKELLFIIVASLIAGLIAKIPDFTTIDEDYYYPRHLGFIVFPVLSAYFAWKNYVPAVRQLIIFAAFLVSVLYINYLPGDFESDTLILSCIHLPLFLWSVTGITYTGDQLHDYRRRIDFLRYNGDLAVMTAVILISGAILTGITLSLFSLIDVHIEEFYFRYIVVWGAAAAPVVGTYLVQTNPQLVNKVSPIIARVFTPLVLVTLVIYLLAVISSGKDPYNDRDFLLLFNILLIGVMAIILFSIAALKNAESRFGTALLTMLSIVTIIVNSIALSAILFRITEWGITPNRLAVLGGNILILINLLIVTYRLFKTFKNKDEMETVEKSIASYLPVYILWSSIVVFVFPVMFGFE